MLHRPEQLHLVIPTGTKVLTRCDKLVGIVVHSASSPDHTYRVRFANGGEASYSRADLTIYKNEGNLIPKQIKQPDLLQFVVYRCVVGSTAYGLATESSDERPTSIRTGVDFAEDRGVGT